MPGTMVPLALLLVTLAPQPVDPCPCFEDAVAIISVILGCYLGFWHLSSHPHLLATPSPFHYSLPFGVPPVLKIAIGVPVLFAWRIVAKRTLHLVLPPIFRFLAPFFTLPRRHYIPSSEYKKYMETDSGLKSIPSVLDIDRSATTALSSSGSDSPAELDVGLRKRLAPPSSSIDVEFKAANAVKRARVEFANPRLHYDVDVLTKFIVCPLRLAHVLSQSKRRLTF